MASRSRSVWWRSRVGLVCVLLVEDDFLIREVMAESLQDAGFEVLEADDGAAAVAFLRLSPERFSILVTDFHMPGDIDGAHVASVARRGSANLPVIIATGRPDILQARWQSELGYQLLKKPYLPSQLLQLVRAAVGSS